MKAGAAIFRGFVGVIGLLFLSVVAALAIGIMRYIFRDAEPPRPPCGTAEDSGPEDPFTRR